MYSFTLNINYLIIICTLYFVFALLLSVILFLLLSYIHMLNYCTFICSEVIILILLYRMFVFTSHYLLYCHYGTIILDAHHILIKIGYIFKFLYHIYTCNWCIQCLYHVCLIMSFLSGISNCI